ncbi:MAG TPA: PAS domain-containing protein, partial [Chitinophagaceae bacterium]|nr:PAS domain-containing protein [Chitinophagaceae bacterium]
MLLLRYLPTFSDWTEALIDSSLLSILIFPIIYIFLYLPLKKSMAEHKLKEANYSYVIENIGEGVGIADTNERFVFANDATEKIFGVGKGELNGVRLDKFFTKESFAFILTQTKERLAGRTTEYESEIVLKDGTKKNILITAAPQFENDVVIGTFAIFRDITEIKKAQETIRYERNLLRTLIDSLPDAIYVKDSKCRKVISNQVDVNNMGFQFEEDVLGKDDYDVFPKEIADAFFADDQSVLQTGQPVLNREESFFDNKNQRQWLLTSKIPMRDEDQKVIGLLGIGLNITDRKSEETRLKLLESVITNAT